MEKMMKNELKKPCIIKDTTNTVLIMNDGFGYHLHGEFMGEYSDNQYYIDEDCTNITHEYLQNTYGEVVSPEHAEFIIELAKVNKLRVYPDFNEIKAKFFTFNKSSALFFYDSEDCIDKDRCKQIKIPLPPKADKQDEPSKQFKIGDEVKTNLGLGHIRLMPDVNNNYIVLINGRHMSVSAANVKKLETPKQELSEWPQVGDDVIAVHECNNLKGKLLALTKKYAIISQGSEEQHLHLNAWTLERPKTPEDELRDELEIVLNSYVISGKPASEHIDEIINVFKKPR